MTYLIGCCACSIRAPCVLHSCSMRAPCVLHSCSISQWRTGISSDQLELRESTNKERGCWVDGMSTKVKNRTNGGTSTKWWNGWMIEWFTFCLGIALFSYVDAWPRCAQSFRIPRTSFFEINYHAWDTVRGLVNTAFHWLRRTIPEAKS